LQEIQEEQKAKEEFYPTYLEIQELTKDDYLKASEMYGSLSTEEKEIYQSIKKRYR